MTEDENRGLNQNGKRRKGDVNSQWLSVPAATTIGGTRKKSHTTRHAFDLAAQRVGIIPAHNGGGDVETGRVNLGRRRDRVESRLDARARGRQAFQTATIEVEDVWGEEVEVPKVSRCVNATELRLSKAAGKLPTGAPQVERRVFFQYVKHSAACLLHVLNVRLHVLAERP